MQNNFLLDGTFDPDQLEKLTHGQWKSRPERQISGFSIDSRNLGEGDLFIAINADRDGHDFLSSAEKNGAIASLVERVQLDVPIPQLLVKDSIKAFHEIAHDHRKKFKGPVVGVTGSCGKTSTKDILGILLGNDRALCTEGNLNNHLGVPLTLLKCDNKVHKYAVVEAGINQIGEMSLLANMIEPTIVLVTIIAPSHLEGLKSVEQIASEKADLFSKSNRTKAVFFPEECLEFKEFKERFEKGDDVMVLREGEPLSSPRQNEAFYSIWTETNKDGGSSQLRLWLHESPSFSFSYNTNIERYGKECSVSNSGCSKVGCFSSRNF